MLRGKRAGLPVVFEVGVTLPPLSTDGRALTMAWARERVEQLSGALYNPEKPEVVEQITALGLEFHLVTKYTSLVAGEATQVTAVPATPVVEPPVTTRADPGLTDAMLGLKGVGVGGGGVGLGSLGNKGPANLDNLGTVGGHGLRPTEDGDSFDKAFGAGGLGGGRVSRSTGYFPPAPGPETR